MPQDWQSWGFLFGIVAAVMIGLIIIVRSRKSFRLGLGDKSFAVGGAGVEHDCKQEDYLVRLSARIELLAAGMAALLDQAIKQGANGPTESIRDDIAKDSSTWQKYLTEKVVKA